MSDQIPTRTFPEVSKVSEAYPATGCLTSSSPPCNLSLNGGESTFKDIPNGSTLCTVNTKTINATFENGVQSQEDSAKGGTWKVIPNITTSNKFDNLVIELQGLVQLDLEKSASPESSVLATKIKNID
ncbi:unnamed protein product, partial [Ilex paraguariensis]